MGVEGRELLRCARTHPNETSTKATATVLPSVRSWNEQTVRRRPNGSLEVTDIRARYELHQESIVLLGYTRKRRVMKSGALPLDKTA